MGNLELLAVYAALDEWRHWLKGAKHPFLVWSDHRNLTYIRTAKRVSDRQARWAQSFSRFNFTLSYRPGSRNCRADALSHLHPGSQPVCNAPQTILPPSRVVGVVTWAIDSAVRAAQRHHPDHGNGPPQLPICPPFCSFPRVGALQPVLLSPRCFPDLVVPPPSFLVVTVCARSKTTHHPPAGLLLHVPLDFVTGLPVSRGNTVRTLSPTMAPNSSPGCGRPSAGELGPRSAAHPGTIRRQMARPNGPTSASRQRCVV